MRLDCYVPESHVEAVKEALFAAGAGKMGDYSRCCFEVRGTGCFRPSADSHPHIGEREMDTQVAEVKIEVLCPAPAMKAIIAAMRAAHPYEVPAFQYWPVEIS